MLRFKLIKLFKFNNEVIIVILLFQIFMFKNESGVFIQRLSDVYLGLTQTYKIEGFATIVNS